MKKFKDFDQGIYNEKISENTDQRVLHTADDLLLNASHSFSTKRFPLRILSSTSNRDDYLYDFSTNTLEIKISKDKLSKFWQEICEKPLKNSGIVLPMEKLTPAEVHAKLVRHNDATWADTVSIVNIVSPHLIFVRRLTSTYKNFQFTLPDNLEKIQWINSDTELLEDPKCLNLNDCIGYYVLAPIEEDVYARARIIDVTEDREYMKIIYIDHGTISWVNRKCLAVMEESLFKFRWQVRSIALHNLFPYSNDLESSKKVVWTKKHVEAVKDVLSNCSVYKFTHYNRLKRTYAADVVHVQLFAAENDLKSQNSTPINDVLIAKYKNLFYKNEKHNQPMFNTPIDISDECDEKLDKNNIPSWKLNFPCSDKVYKPSPIYNFVREDGIIGYSPDHWTLEKLKDKGYLVDGECLVVFLQAPMDNSHPLRLGGYLVPGDDIKVIQQKCKEEKIINSGVVRVKRLLSELCREIRINTFDKIRKYSEQYKVQNKHASISLDDIIVEWKNNRPFYIVTERKAKNNELMFFRAEVTGFHKEINYFLLRIRYLDFNGTGICCMHEAYKLSKVVAEDMPFNIGFTFDEILIKNENIINDEESFSELISHVNEKLPFSEPVLIRLNLSGNRKHYPSKDLYSKWPLIVDNVFQTDFKIDSMWKIDNLKEDDTFDVNSINFKDVSKKYRKYFKEESSTANCMINFYTKYNYMEFSEISQIIC
uniref:Tudor domain-containing protein n=1 Tax=Strongyloides papillosus TaxID=174720 RepID=A0A0N5B6B5_STREA